MQFKAFERESAPQARCPKGHHKRLFAGGLNSQKGPPANNSLVPAAPRYPEKVQDIRKKGLHSFFRAPRGTRQG